MPCSPGKLDYKMWAEKRGHAIWRYIIIIIINNNLVHCEIEEQ